MDMLFCRWWAIFLSRCVNYCKKRCTINVSPKVRVALHVKLIFMKKTGLQELLGDTFSRTLSPPISSKWQFITCDNPKKSVLIWLALWSATHVLTASNYKLEERTRTVVDRIALATALWSTQIFKWLHSFRRPSRPLLPSLCSSTNQKKQLEWVPVVWRSLAEVIGLSACCNYGNHPSN